MSPRRPAPAPATCVAPLEDGELRPDSPLCGKPAAATRVVEGVALPLCAAHARALDAERARS